MRRPSQSAPSDRYRLSRPRSAAPVTRRPPPPSTAPGARRQSPAPAPRIAPASQVSADLGGPRTPATSARGTPRRASPSRARTPPRSPGRDGRGRPRLAGPRRRRPGSGPETAWRPQPQPRWCSRQRSGLSAPASSAPPAELFQRASAILFFLSFVLLLLLLLLLA